MRINIKEYLQSSYWKDLRDWVLKRDHHTCQECGGNAKEVHHTSYKRLGEQGEEYDCISLCKECHREKH